MCWRTRTRTPAMLRGRVRRLLPRLAELIAVEHPEDPTDDEKNHLVEWSGEGQRSKCAAPAKRSRDPTVTDDDSGSPKRSAKVATHAVTVTKSAFRATLASTCPRNSPTTSSMQL